MIYKAFETNKINLEINNILLLYGQNDGARNEEISRILEKNKNSEILKYNETEILNNDNLIFENVLSNSLFVNKKIRIINKATDKLLKIIENFGEKKLAEVILIVKSDNLEKKSKLRIFFEKSVSYVCVPFYPDNQESLTKIAYKFLKDNNLSLSQSNINLLINRCNGDRGILKKELNKIYFFGKNGKKLTTESLLKLTNLIENHNISELVDNCLAKNKSKTLFIINENNLSADDCIIITRTFLLKLKKLLKLSINYSENKDLNKTISSAKPPIFWKDKEITKKQILNWETKQISQLIFDINSIELQIKKDASNAINIISDFIITKSSVNNYS